MNKCDRIQQTELNNITWRLFIIADAEQLNFQLDLQEVYDKCIFHPFYDDKVYRLGRYDYMRIPFTTFFLFALLVKITFCFFYVQNELLHPVCD